MNAISFEGVRKRYVRQEALKGVSFAVEEGDYLGLVGVNGAGKTTLIKCLLDFCEVTGGAIRIFDTPHTEGGARSRPRRARSRCRASANRSTSIRASPPSCAGTRRPGGSAEA